MYVCMYVRTYVRTNLCVYICIYTHLFMYLYNCVCIYACMCISIYIYIYRERERDRYRCALCRYNIYMYIYIYIHIYIYIYRERERDRQREREREREIQYILVAEGSAGDEGQLVYVSEGSRVHPVSITRFLSFRTQPLENLRVDSVKNGFLSNPAPGENLESGNLVMETGCKSPRYVASSLELTNFGLYMYT